MSCTVTHVEAEQTLGGLVGYAVVSARNLLEETPEYGPIRLLELAVRVLDAFRRLGVAPAWADRLREQLSSGGMSLTEGPEAFQALLDRLVADVVDLRLAGQGRDQEGRP